MHWPLSILSLCKVSDFSRQIDFEPKKPRRGTSAVLSTQLRLSLSSPIARDSDSVSTPAWSTAGRW